jgi:hypothetical protein
MKNWTEDIRKGKSHMLLLFNYLSCSQQNFSALAVSICSVDEVLRCAWEKGRLPFAKSASQLT